MAAQVTPLPKPPFHWNQTSPTQRKTFLAVSLGWMLDAFDVLLLHSIVLATLMRQFAMSKSTAGLLNTIALNTITLTTSAIGSLAD